jgi:hypothetical protein
MDQPGIAPKGRVAGPPGWVVPDRWRAVAARWTSLVFAAVIWSSAAIFGLYIAAFYAGPVFDGAVQRWNDTLPRLYDPGAPLATGGIGMHFVAGAVSLALRPIQLVGRRRASVPALHWRLGGVYVFASLLAGLGGLAFIAVEVTIGGWGRAGRASVSAPTIRRTPRTAGLYRMTTYMPR